jgi:hypothetical protein
MLIKIIALGPIGYNRDVMNFGDGVIVLLSIMDLSLESTVDLKSIQSLRVLRAVRVVKVTRLLRSL